MMSSTSLVVVVCNASLYGLFATLSYYSMCRGGSTRCAINYISEQINHTITALSPVEFQARIMGDAPEQMAFRSIYLSPCSQIIFACSWPQTNQ